MNQKGKSLQLREQSQWQFVVRSRLGIAVRTTKGYWALITTVKHPTLAGKEQAVIRTLIEPDQVRKSRSDDSVYLFYRKTGKRYLCVVTKKVEVGKAFIITAYVTENIKEGHVIWKK